jgi:5-methylcytosine-specific restriction endonuclease McrA
VAARSRRATASSATAATSAAGRPRASAVERLCNWIARTFPVRSYDDYIRSAAWRRRAANCKRRARYRCALCNTVGPLNAHHRTYERLGFELPSDLIALCRYCHAKHHDKLAKP